VAGHIDEVAGVAPNFAELLQRQPYDFPAILICTLAEEGDRRLGSILLGGLADLLVCLAEDRVAPRNPLDAKPLGALCTSQSIGQDESLLLERATRCRPVAVSRLIVRSRRSVLPRRVTRKPRGPYGFAYILRVRMDPMRARFSSVSQAVRERHRLRDTATHRNAPHPPCDMRDDARRVPGRRQTPRC
jgi:hypothetical protein